jgi:hypothetical protein
MAGASALSPVITRAHGLVHACSADRATVHGSSALAVPRRCLRNPQWEHRASLRGGQNVIAWHSKWPRQECLRCLSRCSRRERRRASLRGQHQRCHTCGGAHCVAMTPTMPGVQILMGSSARTYLNVRVARLLGVEDASCTSTRRACETWIRTMGRQPRHWSIRRGPTLHARKTALLRWEVVPTWLGRPSFLVENVTGTRQKGSISNRGEVDVEVWQSTGRCQRVQRARRDGCPGVRDKR